MAILISADSDLVGPISAIREKIPQKRIIVFFPPGRFSAALKKVADVQLSLGRGLLTKSQFPDKVIRDDGYILKRPSEWQ